MLLDEEEGEDDVDGAAGKPSKFQASMMGSGKRAGRVDSRSVSGGGAAKAANNSDSRVVAGVNCKRRASWSPGSEDEENEDSSEDLDLQGSTALEVTDMELQPSPDKVSMIDHSLYISTSCIVFT